MCCTVGCDFDVCGKCAMLEDTVLESIALGVRRPLFPRRCAVTATPAAALEHAMIYGAISGAIAQCCWEWRSRHGGGAAAMRQPGGVH